jgi:L-asparaginase/Glu-tRNA(Gln) amidotransferase subunit D
LQQLDAAYATAKQSGLAEVLICSYPKDSHSSSVSILRATHSRLTHVGHTPIFESINHPPLGSVSNGRFVLQQLQAQPIQPQPSLQLRTGYRSDVLWLPTIEGMTPPHSLLDMPPGGLVLSSGVAGQFSDPWRSFIWQLRERGVVVLACQQDGSRDRRLQHSESGRQLLSWGVCDGTLYLPEVALWKLGWALAQSTQDPSTTPGMWLEQNIAGECREV